MANIYGSKNLATDMAKNFMEATIVHGFHNSILADNIHCYTISGKIAGAILVCEISTIIIIECASGRTTHVQLHMSRTTTQSTISHPVTYITCNSTYQQSQDSAVILIARPLFGREYVRKGAVFVARRSRAPACSDS